ncbi:MAG: hypothetical protein DMF54_01270 [Acidobacteria bacterium]|nr:MAG: hypothetical protein DMF55_06105 [Acidobacteriota bacterium]PYQ68281.1 MAG: hypothetical protein DMF54_01270 [Acidobacteriota bacterium]
MICAKLKPAVSGLEKEFPGVRAKNVDATTAGGKAAIRNLGFESHGIVIRSAGGKVLWKQPDHTVKMEDVRAELARRTGRR